MKLSQRNSGKNPGGETPPARSPPFEIYIFPEPLFPPSCVRHLFLFPSSCAARQDRCGTHNCATAYKHKPTPPLLCAAMLFAPQACSTTMPMPYVYKSVTRVASAAGASIVRLITVSRDYRNNAALPYYAASAIRFSLFRFDRCFPRGKIHRYRWERSRACVHYGRC